MYIYLQVFNMFTFIIFVIAIKYSQYLYLNLTQVYISTCIYSSERKKNFLNITKRVILVSLQRKCKDFMPVKTSPFKKHNVLCKAITKHKSSGHSTFRPNKKGFTILHLCPFSSSLMSTVLSCFQTVPIVNSSFLLFAEKKVKNMTIPL